jgi:hypothetical protein
VPDDSRLTAPNREVFGACGQIGGAATEQKQAIAALGQLTREGAPDALGGAKYDRVQG